MACYSTIRAYRGVVKPNGKVTIVFDRRESKFGSELILPCGNCIGCRLDRSRDWAVRCLHEAQMHERNCFITLTYDDEHLPKNGSVDVREFQLFMKKLRKKYGDGIRFFHCGEYGEKLSRPHYHALLFGFDFDDKVLWSVRRGTRAYKSESLSALWGKGMTEVGDVNYKSAAYVARYILKKVNGENADGHYGDKMPEYITMSRKPGIGFSWFQKFGSDVFPSDNVVVNGVKSSVPPYYDNLLKKNNEAVFESIKRKRVRDALKKADDNDTFRSRVKEIVKMARIKNLKRQMEDI